MSGGGKLRRSNPSRRGYRRVRAGRGVSYRDLDGSLLTDPELRARIGALGIPPAWTDVWIAPHPNGHIQATGVDAAGRRQYIYHPTWREQKDRAKFERMLQLAEALPTARRQVTLDLRQTELNRSRVLAAAFRMLDSGSLRIGSERYTEVNGSHGLSTLLCSHVTVRGDRIDLRFPAKSGKQWDSAITDPDLAAVLRRLKRRGPNARLLAYREGQLWHPLSAADVNGYVRERTGGSFSAKDFRTLRGTLAAATSLARTGPQPKRRQRAKAIGHAVQAAAAVLGNTPTIAKKSYIDPRVIDHYNSGETIDPARLASAESELRALLFR